MADIKMRSVISKARIISTHFKLNNQCRDHFYKTSIHHWSNNQAAQDLSSFLHQKLEAGNILTLQMSLEPMNLQESMHSKIIRSMYAGETGSKMINSKANKMRRSTAWKASLPPLIPTSPTRKRGSVAARRRMMKSISKTR